MKWVPLPTDYSTNYKLQHMPAEVFRTFINMRCIARNGFIPMATECAWLLRISVRKMQKAMARLSEDDLIIATPEGFLIKDWQQFARDDESKPAPKTNAERQRDYRNRNAHQQVKGVTQRVTPVTNPVTTVTQTVTDPVTDPVTKVTPYTTEHNNTKNNYHYHYHNNSPGEMESSSLHSDDADAWPTEAIASPRPTFRSVGDAASQMLETVMRRSEAIRNAREQRRGGSSGDSVVSERLERRGGEKPVCKAEPPSSLPTTPDAETAQDGQEATSLIFPPCLSDPKAKDTAMALLEPCNGASQSILDELAARAQQTDIKSPIGYLRGLVTRYKSGEFVPEASVTIAAKREKAKAISRLADEDDASGDCTAYQVMRAEAQKLGIPIDHINPRMMTADELNEEMDFISQQVREIKSQRIAV